MSNRRQRPIMIIDDDTSIMVNMEEAFSQMDREVFKANNGLNGIQLLKNLKDHEYPCCIILDLMMPEMTGQEFIFHIQALGKTELDSIPIVISSAAAGVESMEVPRVVHKLKKPIDLSDLEKISQTYY